MQSSIFRKDKRMIFRMLFFLTIVVFVECRNENSFPSVISYQDTIFSVAELEVDSNSNEIFLNCTVYNFLKDSLIFLPVPFLVESNILDTTFTSVSSGYNFTTPNLIYIINTQEPFRFDADGEFKPYFDKFPNLILLVPDDSLFIRFKIPQEVRFDIELKEIDFFGLIVYTTMREAFFYAEQYKLAKEFETHLRVQRVIHIEPKIFEKFRTLLSKSETSNVELSRFIWKVFDKKIFFRK